MADSLSSLLDRALPADYRREATTHVAAEVETVVAKTESAVIFRVSTEWLALSTSLFQGVASAGPVHSLPNRRDGVLSGITQVHGELLLCMSLGALLGITERAAPQMASRQGSGGEGGERLMIVRGVGGALALLVQAVHGVHRYRPDELHDVPATLAHAGTRYTTGMLSWNDHWVARLNDGLVFHAFTRALS